MYENVSILLHINSKIDIHNGMSYECILMTFRLCFYIYYIDDNVMCFERITIVCYHNLLHEIKEDILDNIIFYIHYKLYLFID